MHRGLYLAVCPLPAAVEIPALRARLAEAFPAPENVAYLDSLIGAPDRPALPRVAAARLGALSLLPALLEAAGYETASLLLCREERGRPFCRPLAPFPEVAVGFDFNLTHSDAHVACALLTGGGRVGLDVEEPVPPSRAEPLIRRYCTEEERAWLRAAPMGASPMDFARIWTVREALAKQDGQGMPLRFDATHMPSSVRPLCGRLPDTGASIALCLPADAGLLRPLLTPASVPIVWDDAQSADAD